MIIKRFLLFILILFVALVSCGAVNDTPDRPSDIVVGDIANGLDPQTELHSYVVGLFAIDSTEIPTDIKMVKVAGIIPLDFLPPIQYATITVPAITPPEIIPQAEGGYYEILNEVVEYYEVLYKLRAKMNVQLTIDNSPPGFYTIRVRARSTSQVLSGMSPEGECYIEVRE